MTLWHGRFADGPADELLAFTESLSFDQRLAADDLDGSRAHVAGLARVGILTADEAEAVTAALGQVGDEMTAGTFAFQPSDEDVHTAIERRVTELAGDAGAKLHTGRSRNDQVATALRLYLRREGADTARRIGELQAVLLDRARAADDVYVPGYTHLQRAQPVLVAHHFLAHFWAFARDVERWRDTLVRTDVSPLGAGALAGSSLPLDPDGVAEALGFDSRFHNSLDAVSDRDFVAEALFVLALTQVHLSRVGEEVVLWTSEEFGFLRLADAYSTGSSMLPQKKNPDIAELARGKAGRLIGDLTGFLATLKGLPLAYNRDLQEDKEPLFDALDQNRLALSATAGLLATAELVPQRMQAAADAHASAAVDLAEWLVQQGVPFREAHARVGAMVRASVERGVGLDELVMTDPELGPDALVLLEPGRVGDASGDTRRRGCGVGRGPARRRERAARHPGRVVPARRLGRTLPRSFFARDPLDLAPLLLNKVLVREEPGVGRVAARLVEVEAYHGFGRPGQPRLPRDDPAHDHHVRAARPPLRVLHLRHALVRQRRGPAPARRRRCGAAARGDPSRGARRHARATCGRHRQGAARPGAVRGSRPAHPGVRADRCPRRHRPHPGHAPPGRRRHRAPHLAVREHAHRPRTGPGRRLAVALLRGRRPAREPQPAGGIGPRSGA